MLAWVWTGHWLANDIIGVSLAVFLIFFLRVPSLRLCAIVMCLLIVYDVFWVFFSKALFGENVMVAVAVQQATNPAAQSACAARFRLRLSAARVSSVAVV